jgi:hypothetical protein
MKKSECEKAIRHLARQWCAVLTPEQRSHPSWLTFKEWLAEKGYSGYLNFRSVAGPDYDAEKWFDDELGQSWR